MKHINKSLLVIGHSSGLTSGAEKSLLETIDILYKKYKIIILLPSCGPFCNALDKRGVEYKIIRYYPVYEKKEYSLLKKILKQLVNMLTLPLFINEARKYDVIYTNTLVIFQGVFLSKLLNKKHVWHVREKIDEDWIGSNFFGEKLQNYALSSKLNNMIFNSYWTMSQFSEDLCPSRSIAYQPVKVDDTTTRDSSENYIVTYIGRISEKKRIIDLINAFSLIKNKKAELHIYGSGSDDYLLFLKNKVAELNINNSVFFMGDTLEPSRRIANSTIVVLPSENEAFGRVTVESMLLGVPVIGSCSGGTAELIEDEITGLLYEPRNIIELMGKIDTLLDDEELRVLLSERAMTWCNASMSEKKYIAVLQKVIGND